MNNARSTDIEYNQVFIVQCNYRSSEGVHKYVCMYA